MSSVDGQAFLGGDDNNNDDFNAQRDRLRAECSSLYDQKRAIESRMEEVQERLMWLDDRIDGSGGDEDDGNLQDEDDGDMQQPPMMARKYGAHAASFTQAEDYLTDPHTQTQTIDDDEGRPNELTTNRTLQSKTPPGLKSSSAATNPFNDLRPPLAQLSDAVGKRKRGEGGGGGGTNTLEKYFVGATGPPSNPYLAMPMAANIASPYQRSRRPWTDAMMRHLRQTFRIKEFRDNQEAIIDTTMRGEDCFVVMRTGGGKSLTYQLPAILECFETNGAPRKVTVVISPLISLICDQEEQMNGFYRGSAVSFTSGLAGGNTEHARRWGLVRDVDYGVAMIFVTPEKVGQSNKFKGEMEKLNNQGRLGRFVVDECHCASQWGHDFRPDYAKLGILKHHFPHIPVLAVTATASERARHDCAKILKLSLGKYKFYRSSANRPNLNYSVRCKPETKEGVVKDIVAYLRENHKGESGIIYTFSKKEANEVASGLSSNGIIAKPYHGDVKDATKTQVQRSWMNNKTQVVVATIAFGLGINKPDVQFVLHHSLSKSLEAYYQESGRAGRDGSPANCVLYYSPKDIPRLLKMVHGDAGEASFWSMARYSQAHGDDALCRHIILATLGEADDNMDMTLVNLQKTCTSTVQRDIGAHCQTVAKVVNTMNLSGEDCTLNQIVTKWRSKSEGDFSFLKDNPPKDLSKEECERIVIYLLLEDVLHPKFAYTPYDTLVYLVLGPNGPPLLASTNPRGRISFPKVTKGKQAESKKSNASLLALADDGGWISSKSTKMKATKSRSKTTGKSKAKATKKSTTAKKVLNRRSNMATIVEIDSSSSESESDDDKDMILAKKLSRESATQKKKQVTDDNSDDSEFCFSD